MGNYSELRLDQLVANLDNPRDGLGEVDALAGSINAIGVLQRLLVTPLDDGRFMVVDGHRRHAAMTSINYDQPIPVEIREMDRAARLTAAVAAGSFSRQISPIDQAKAFRALEEMGLTRAQIEQRTGCNQPMISTRLRLLELTPDQQQAIHEGRLSLQKAKAAVYALGRRAPDKKPRTRRPTTSSGGGYLTRDGCPSCGQPLTAGHNTDARTPIERVLMCDDCDTEFAIDDMPKLVRHVLTVHGRRIRPSERTPLRRGMKATA